MVSRGKLGKTLSHEKGGGKMLGEIDTWLKELLDNRVDLGNCETNVSQHDIVVLVVTEGDQCSPAMMMT